jgi:uncharacterized membrane protein
MENPILIVALRYVHIVSTAVLVGGMVFMSVALKPALKTLDEERRRMLQQAVERGFKRAVYLCFLGLLISGAYNWIRLADQYKEMGPKGNIVIGIKVLLAVMMFVIISGRDLKLIRLPGKACHMINLHLVAIIILLAGLLGYWRSLIAG